jgi:hypothetical protein
MRDDFNEGRFSEDQQVRWALRALPRREPPAGLTTSLRVIASRERQRTLARQSLRQVCVNWLERVRLSGKDIMRPLALPLAGGVFSAVVLFSMFVVPTYPLRGNGGLDVPTMLTTEATVKGAAPFGVEGGDLVVDVSLDDQGRMVDYQIIGGTGVDPQLRRRLENLLLFTEFVPATAFGQPTRAKLRLTLFSSHIDVKG